MAIFLQLLTTTQMTVNNGICTWKKTVYKLQHDKTNKMSVSPAKTQISLGIRPVWLESSLCTQWVATDPSFLHADSEDSDQSLCWAHSHFVGFVMSQLICYVMGLYTFLSQVNIAIKEMVSCWKEWSIHYVLVIGFDINSVVILNIRFFMWAELKFHKVQNASCRILAMTSFKILIFTHYFVH